MVELPDTASGSEIPHGHNSTRIVPCFNFAYIAGCKKQNQQMRKLDFRVIFRRSNNLIPVVW